MSPCVPLLDSQNIVEVNKLYLSISSSPSVHTPEQCDRLIVLLLVIMSCLIQSKKLWYRLNLNILYSLFVYLSTYQVIQDHF